MYESMQTMDRHEIAAWLERIAAERGMAKPAYDRAYQALLAGVKAIASEIAGQGDPLKEIPGILENLQIVEDLLREDPYVQSWASRRDRVRQEQASRLSYRDAPSPEELQEIEVARQIEELDSKRAKRPLRDTIG